MLSKIVYLDILPSFGTSPAVKKSITGFSLRSSFYFVATTSRITSEPYGNDGLVFQFVISANNKVFLFVGALNFVVRRVYNYFIYLALVACGSVAQVNRQLPNS